MAAAADENEPEVQRNGFEAIQETADIPDSAMGDFYDDFFDPSDTWEDNLDGFWEFWRGIESTIEGWDEEELREELGEADE